MLDKLKSLILTRCIVGQTVAKQTSNFPAIEKFAVSWPFTGKFVHLFTAWLRKGRSTFSYLILLCFESILSGFCCLNRVETGLVCSAWLRTWHSRIWARWRLFRQFSTFFSCFVHSDGFCLEHRLIFVLCIIISWVLIKGFHPLPSGKS